MVPQRYMKVATIIWVICITVLSLMHTPSGAEHQWWYFPGFDKYVHIIMYSVLSVCLFTGFTRNFLYVVILNAGYGLLMEYCQKWFTTWRTFDWNDFLADFIGAVFGYMVILYFVLPSKKAKNTR